MKKKDSWFKNFVKNNTPKFSKFSRENCAKWLGISYTLITYLYTNNIASDKTIKTLLLKIQLDFGIKYNFEDIRTKIKRLGE